jgi:hypothetical protein
MTAAPRAAAIRRSRRRGSSTVSATRCKLVVGREDPGGRENGTQVIPSVFFHRRY